MTEEEKNMLDFFAGLALIGIIGGYTYPASNAKKIANDSYEIAAEMLAQREIAVWKIEINREDKK